MAGTGCAWSDTCVSILWIFLTRRCFWSCAVFWPLFCAGACNGIEEKTAPIHCLHSKAAARSKISINSRRRYVLSRFRSYLYSQEWICIEQEQTKASITMIDKFVHCMPRMYLKQRQTYARTLIANLICIYTSYERCRHRAMADDGMSSRCWFGPRILRVWCHQVIADKGVHSRSWSSPWIGCVLWGLWRARACQSKPSHSSLGLCIGRVLREICQARADENLPLRCWLGVHICWVLQETCQERTYEGAPFRSWFGQCIDRVFREIAKQDKTKACCSLSIGSVHHLCNLKE